MYDTCHINGTWGSKEMRRLKLTYNCGKPQTRGPSFVGEVDPSRHHDILLHSIKGCSR